MQKPAKYGKCISMIQKKPIIIKRKEVRSKQVARLLSPEQNKIEETTNLATV